MIYYYICDWHEEEQRLVYPSSICSFTSIFFIHALHLSGGTNFVKLWDYPSIRVFLSWHSGLWPSKTQVAGGNLQPSVLVLLWYPWELSFDSPEVDATPSYIPSVARIDTIWDCVILHSSQNIFWAPRNLRESVTGRRLSWRNWGFLRLPIFIHCWGSLLGEPKYIYVGPVLSNQLLPTTGALDMKNTKNSLLMVSKWGGIQKYHALWRIVPSTTFQAMIIFPLIGYRQ